ncbi:MAG: HPr family phosphocarrier protein [Oscillospiraceae bacterium]|jgi:phosphocarrier protein|nr:HPr family phosphocarrier protein [Oscillospiraceae bacterium]
MLMKEAKITGKMGLHARPATFFIQKANEFECSIWLEKEDRRVNAKSLLGVLSLAVGQDETIKIISDGSDETDAVATLLELINSNFAE